MAEANNKTFSTIVIAGILNIAACLNFGYLEVNTDAMETLLLIACLLIVVAIFLIILFRPKNQDHLNQLRTKLDSIQENLSRIETGLKEDFRINRVEISRMGKDDRRELNESLKDFALSQRSKFDELKAEQKELTVKTVAQLDKVIQKTEEKITALSSQAKQDSESMHESLAAAIKGFQENFEKNVKSFNDLQREKFSVLEVQQGKLTESTEKKLDQMRETVDEKLQKTLNERLGQSFELVRTQLEGVQKGLGEMQTLAQDVGGLKRVLTNVKMRGGFGEVQLHMLLESILAPEQYEANIAVKPGTGERVEFAIKFPNKDGARDYVWLPIDAKFPKDAYEYLQNAYDTSDMQLIEQAQKGLESVIRKMAKDICEKYIDVPNTTNFGILFLPFEGLFAEVVRKASLLEEIQRSCNVIITGPTTLAVILNSLQMGFRTLAIQKRSSEVWQVLSIVKKEFTKFGGLLEKAHANIQAGLDQLDEVAGKRTRAIQRTLKNVEIANDQAPDLIGGATEELVDDEED